MELSLVDNSINYHLEMATLGDYSTWTTAYLGTGLYNESSNLSPGTGYIFRLNATYGAHSISYTEKFIFTAEGNFLKIISQWY